MSYGNTSRYFNSNATLEQEVAHRKYVHAALKTDKNMDGTRPYAIAYGFVDRQGRKKLLRYNPVFSTAAQFDRYMKKHKQIVLAVFNHAD